MNKEIIYSKITSLKRCIERIKSKMPFTVKRLKEDFDLQDIISLNLQRAVQISVDVSAHILAGLDIQPSDSMAGSFERLKERLILSEKTCNRMKKSVGYRNLAVHEYSSIDWEIVYSVVTKNLDDFRTFSREIVEWVEKNNMQ